MGQMYDNKDSQVSIIEQGDLTIINGSASTSIGTPSTLTGYTVPTGKVFTVKRIYFSGGGTYTNGRLTFNDGTTNQNIQAITGTHYISFPEVMTLPAGWTINFLGDVTVAGNSSFIITGVLGDA